MAKDKRSTGSYDPADTAHRNVGPVFKDLKAFQDFLPKRDYAFKRIVGIDLGTNTGFSFADVPQEPSDAKIPIIGGLWDLSLARYDTGAIQHIRLKTFLDAVRPDLVMFEDVKFVGTSEKMNAKTLTGVIARIASSAELLGGFKITLATWCEERRVPCEGVGIGVIKKFATGKGNAGKPDMIKAANELFGVSLSAVDYEANGDDNIADAMFVCAMGVEQYARGLK